MSDRTFVVPFLDGGTELMEGSSGKILSGSLSLSSSYVLGLSIYTTLKCPPFHMFLFFRILKESFKYVEL